MQTVKDVFDRIRKDSYLCALLAVVVLGVLLFMSVSKGKETRKEYESRISAVTDSLNSVIREDSIAYMARISSLDSQYSSAKHVSDSLDLALSMKKSESHTYIKTVYRDSIREMYVDNSELTVEYEERIRRLCDSISALSVTRVDTVIVYVDRVRVDSVHRVHSESSSSTVENVTVTADPRFAVYVEGNGFYDIKDGVGVSAEAGAKWFFAGPLYLKGGVGYQDGVRAIVGIGGELRF